MSITHLGGDSGANSGRYALRHAGQVRPLRTLAEHLTRRRAPDGLDAVGWVLRAGKRIEILHRLGVPHGDVSTHTIESKGLSPRSDAQLGPVELGAAPIHFLSPERLAGAAVTTADDAWALGVILYELLTGEPPFSGETRRELLGRIQSDASRPLAEFGIHCATLQRLVDLLLHPQLGQRLLNVHALVRALVAWRPDNELGALPALDEAPDFRTAHIRRHREQRPKRKRPRAALRVAEDDAPTQEIDRPPASHSDVRELPRASAADRSRSGDDETEDDVATVEFDPIQFDAAAFASPRDEGESDSALDGFERVDIAAALDEVLSSSAPANNQHGPATPVANNAMDDEDDEGQLRHGDTEDDLSERQAARKGRLRRWLAAHREIQAAGWAFAGIVCGELLARGVDAWLMGW